ncbi:MAG TPA: bifunctional riboflavin kinase/FAD synthetase [Actinomycetota bacterium]|nr:bifunctional riboflavin kinase/FAD synthetase [Actinomycetota bacterium]
MLVFRGLGELPPEQDPVALTIGNFDGVHLGHRAILDRLAAHASAVGGRPTVLTFDPHPQAVLRGHAPLALVTAERKLELLEEAGVARVVVLPFDRPLSLVEPESFVTDVLVGKLGVRAVVVGANFRFGHRARGDTPMLASMGEALGFSFEAVPMSELDGRRLSSTEIRNAIGACDLAWSNRALGRPHRVPGRIVRGRGRGVGLGFPTANLEAPHGFCLPGLGIYAGYLLVEGQRLVSAISVGTNPTYGEGNPVTLEAYALDFTGDLYGEEGEVEFSAHLRPERAFATEADLAEAIEGDVAEVRRLLRSSQPFPR